MKHGGFARKTAPIKTAPGKTTPSKTTRNLVALPFLIVFGFFAFGVSLTARAPRAYAVCGICDPMMNSVEDTILEKYLDLAHLTTQTVINAHTDLDFRLFKQWLVDDYFKQYILPAMMMMAEQMSAVAMQQMEILGTFLDAKNQLETERLYGQLAARAHKDYHPSEGMCTIGTVARSLAGADRNGDMTALVMAEHALDRQLMNANVAAADGHLSDVMSRADQFKKDYCDKNDNNGGLSAVCASSVTDARKNKDIDFVRTLWHPLSLDINFNDTTATDDEKDILALEANLYSHDTFTKPLTQNLLRDNPGNQAAYLDMRSVVAKRSVAENSFHAIAAMKAQGTTDTANTAKYLQAAIKDLNPSMSDAEAKQIIGANPSYYAQMEILTKKLIENPQFFTDLYEQPANVARKGVALQAIGLMQARDTYKSHLRSESIISVLLELEVMRAQRKVQDEIGRLAGNK